MALLDLTSPALDKEWGAQQVGEDDRNRWLIKPMLNGQFRIIGVLKQEHVEVEFPEFGWCYANKYLALRGAALFDPEIHDEPMFWRKRAERHIRRAPRREERPDYNRARCLHGSYIDIGMCQEELLCEEAPWPPEMLPVMFAARAQSEG